ncbi:MAG: hypothetical protein PHG03_05040 [Bacilli bacterium]|nr:hypothetical protein [Bacilli bacterium]MDD4795900.1 hypothetical protein [Bacilli bacterium]
MITKSLSDLSIDMDNFQEKMKNIDDEEEKLEVNAEFKNILKLYLAGANYLIKETFKTEITPFKKNNSQNALYRGDAIKISKKTKAEFFKEIDNIIKSSIYLSLEDEKKIMVDNALSVYKNYYQDILE